MEYAGSLVTPMEGPIKAALAQRTGLTLEGEGKGSKALANLIRDGVRHPDVFISADRSLVDALAARGLVARSETFGSAELGLGYTDGSRLRTKLDALCAPTCATASARAILEILATPGIRIARTDPKLDPKGERTVRAMQLLDPQHGMQALGEPENPAQIFPEEDLLVRLESGNADVGFVYSTEARARHLHFVPLPGKASLSDEITYTLAILNGAPHPEAARTFAAFVTHGDGRAILEAAGVRYRK